MQAVVDGRWDAARAILKTFPEDDAPSRKLLEMMAGHGNEPPADWDGAFTMGTASRTGSGVPWWGMQRGQRPLARRRPGRREISEGVSVQARTTCRMPPHQPAGIAERAVSSQRRFHKGGRPLLATVPHRRPPAARACGRP